MRYFLILILLAFNQIISGQCLSAVNPVGGTTNLLSLPRNSLRLIAFYKYGYGDSYFEGSQKSDLDIIDKAYYHYAAFTAGYGLFKGFTLEVESGYFINKTQEYLIGSSYKLASQGLSNMVVSGKIAILTNHMHRFYISLSPGVKIPFSREDLVKDGVVLPVELQPSTHTYGGVMQLFMVKENSAWGIRYFLTHRYEKNFSNKNQYQLGDSYTTAAYFSKHIMSNKIKNDYTYILQLRHEFRNKNQRDDQIIFSSGANQFFFSPQLNLTLEDNWNISLLFDIPLFQSFNGTQLANKIGISLVLTTDMDFEEIKRNKIKNH